MSLSIRELPRYSSRVNTASQAYKDNRQQMEAILAGYRQELAKTLFEGQDKHVARARAEGKHTARERIELLLDPDSPFLELLCLAGYGSKPINLGGTSVAGLGYVSGVLCLIQANAGTIKGGSIDKTTLEKGLRLNEIALQNRLPVIYLVESSGANLPEQAYIFNKGGITFREITRRSKLGIPSIAVVFGNSTAGGAYVPGMSDFGVYVKGQAKVFLAGPPLVKMATSEVSTDEELGGAEMHSRTSGVSDYLAQDEYHGLRLAREILAVLATQLPAAPVPPTLPQPPALDADELLGIVQANLRKPIDAREIIARVVDGSRFSEFKPDWGSTLITGFAHLHGYPVGILANNGVIFSESANKGAHFIQYCNKWRIPLLFFQNTTGFMVGKAYEEGGIIKHGAKLINAVSNSEVPAISIMIGSSYGAGNYAMCGRAYQPRFVFSYPNSKIAVMGPEQLAGVMDIIQRSAAEKAGMPYDEQQAAVVKGMVMQQIEAESNALYATGQLWDDGIIDPRDTRDVLGLTLAAVHAAGFEGAEGFGIFRM